MGDRDSRWSEMLKGGVRFRELLVFKCTSPLRKPRSIHYLTLQLSLGLTGSKTVKGAAVVGEQGELLYAEGEIAGLLKDINIATAFQDCFRIERERGEHAKKKTAEK